MKTAKKVAHVNIRWLIRRDLAEVLAIDPFGDLGWGEKDFLDCLANRNVVGLVAEHGITVVGFMVYALSKSRIDLLNFVVHPEWRRFGVGQQMMAKMVGKLHDSCRTKLVIRVPEGNLGMQLFLRSIGFRAEKIDGDSYVFVRRLAEVAVFEEY